MKAETSIINVKHHDSVFLEPIIIDSNELFEVSGVLFVQILMYLIQTQVKYECVYILKQSIDITISLGYHVSGHFCLNAIEGCEEVLLVELHGFSANKVTMKFYYF